MESLTAAGREAGVLVLGAVGMLFVAGLLEGFFRQLVTDVTIRWGVVAATATFWVAYLGFAGRREEA